MKNLKVIALSLLAIFVMGGIAFAIPQPSAPGIKKKLEGTDQAESTKVYKLVRFSTAGLDSTSRVSGDAVVYDTNSDDGVSVRTTTTSADGAFAGILVTALQTSDAVTGTSVTDDIGRRNWGFIQVHGYCLANTTAGGVNANSAGDIFTTSTDAGVITAPNQVAAATAQNQGVIALVRGKGGIFLDANTTETQVEVLVEKE